MAPPARAEAIPPAIAPNIITSLKWLETNNLFNNLIQRNQSAAFSSGKVRPNHETNINIIARRTGKDVNSHTVLDGIITTIMATIQRINIIGSREGSRNRRRLKANQTGKKFRVGIKSNISTNRNSMDLAAKGLGAKEWNNSLKTKLSLLPKKLFRIRMSRNFGMKMLTMTNLSTECLIQLTKLGYDATPFNQILKQNAKREMRLRLGKVTVADVLAAQP